MKISVKSKIEVQCDSMNELINVEEDVQIYIACSKYYQNMSTCSNYDSLVFTVFVEVDEMSSDLSSASAIMVMKDIYNRIMKTEV